MRSPLDHDAVAGSAQRAGTSQAASLFLMTNLSLVLAEHASRYMTVVDLVMQAMQVRVRDIDAESATGLRDRLSSVDVHDDMVRRVQSIPGDAALLLFGADGALINYTRQGPVPAINADDRDFFKHFRDHDDPTSTLAHRRSVG
jgi:hypothetical protein